MLECECCRKIFKNINGLTKHMIQHNKSCFDFYIKKYKTRSLFPWKKFSNLSKKEFIECEICGLRVSTTGRNNKRGISHHVLQHSKKCLDGYIFKYGEDRTKWPQSTYLNIKVCEDCGAVLKDPRSKEFCQSCRSNNHNVMKNKEVIKKNIESNKPIKSSFKYRNNLSKKAKERYKNNPEYSKKQKEYMLNGGAIKALKAVKSPSKPELKLRELIKELFPSAEFTHPILNYAVDIAIPELKVIVEYDGSYYHQDKKKDLLREKDIKENGWKVLRYRDYIPGINKLKIDIENLSKGNKTSIKRWKQKERNIKCQKEHWCLL